MTESKTTDSKTTGIQAPESQHTEGGSNPSRYSVMVVSDPSQLSNIVDQWIDLAEHASEPNVFYEPNFLLAAVKHLKLDVVWHVILVCDSQTNTLHGFFPFIRKRGFFGLRLLSLFTNEFSFLTSPLIRIGFEAEVIDAVFQSVSSLKNVDAIEFPYLHGAGKVHEELVMFLRSKQLETLHVDHYCRAEFNTGTSLEEYLNQAIRGHHQREYRRKERKLESLGQFELRSNRDPKYADCWSGWFLQLEASGWKGKAGTALNHCNMQAEFFRDFVRTGSERGTVEMIGLFLNGEPIAMACTLLSNRRGFTYKIAFNEEYRKHSPGVLLILKIMKRFLESDELDCLDSCAVPDHPMINRIWKDRRPIQHLIFSTGRVRSSLTLAAIPFLRCMKRIFMRRRSSSLD